jgi:predicted nuclease of predicted toxin-antitoxin system
MRFLIDQDVYAATAGFLDSLGHDVVRAAQIGLSCAGDAELLRIAEEQDRILITRDRDFGGLVFIRSLGAGVLYLRVLPSTQHAVHDELKQVLSTYTEGELKQAFVVIEPGGHRIRRLPKK